jgi:putative redox protein
MRLGTSVDWDMAHEIVKRYSNGEVTVVWQPALCRHAGACARGLPLVFNPRRRPWIEMQHSDSETIAAQVDRCPSGALSWERDAPR